MRSTSWHRHPESEIHCGPAFRGGAGGTSMPKQRMPAGRIILPALSLAGLGIFSSVSQPLGAQRAHRQCRSIPSKAASP